MSSSAGARSGRTISLSGVYGGETDPLPMLTLFDKQVQLRMGQANVRNWTDDIMPLLIDGDPFDVEDSRHTGCLSTKPRTPTRGFRSRRTATSRRC